MVHRCGVLAFRWSNDRILLEEMANSDERVAARFDLKRVRGEFPFLEVEVAGKPVIYLDNGASTQKPRVVIDRMAEVAAHEYANVHRGIHELSNRATAAYEAARARAALFLNAPSEDCVVFTRGTTESINLVANTWGEQNVQAGDVILLTELEHHSNLIPWQQLAARKSASLRFVPVLENGAGLDADVVQTMLADQPKLFAFPHISNTMAVTTPAREFCSMARAVGAVTLIDAAQSVSHIPVDVQEIGCDFLACSGHKMCGPTGIGLLYGRSELLNKMPPWQLGGEMVDRVDFTTAKFRPPPSRFEAGTPAIIEAAGLDAAMDFVDDVGLEAIRDHSDALARHAAAELRRLPGVHVFGPVDNRAHLVTFTMEGIHAHDIVFFCNDHGIALRAGHHCAQPLMRKLGAPASARASFHFYNQESDVVALIKTLREAIAFFN